MYGRGRGSYLGLLLESQLGKSAVNHKKDRPSDKENNEIVKDSCKPISQPEQGDGEKSPQPMWTSLDLLGNLGKRSRRGSSESAAKPDEESYQVDQEDQADSNIFVASVSLNSATITDQKPNSGKKIHLIAPQEFRRSPSSSGTDEAPAETSEKDSSSENNVSSPSPKYVPPHLRKGYSGKPEIFPDPLIKKYTKVDEPVRVVSSDEMTPASLTANHAESELNWQKWKLERDFKKLLKNLSGSEIVGLDGDIRKICEASQLSTKFPGASEVNVLVNLLVTRVIEQKDSFEVAVEICQLLNVMYQDEFSANLKDVLRQKRQETFSGVTNKNASCENFCIFVGKLCDIAKNETKGFKDCLRQSVIGCLHEWISLFQNADECSPEAKLKVHYLCYLLEVTKTVLNSEKRLWIKSCFGKIKNCILSDKVERPVKENLVDYLFMKCLFQSAALKETEIPKVTAAEQCGTEKTNTSSEAMNILPLDLKKTNAGAQTVIDVKTKSDDSRVRSPSGSPDQEGKNHGIPAVDESEEPDSKNPELISKREVSFGEKKTDIMKFRDEKTQAGNPFVNYAQSGNERTFSKYKGRGRGRRDVSGSLEGSKKDSNESQGFTADTSESHYRDARGYQYGSVRDNTGYKRDSPETSRRFGSQNRWKDMKPWKDGRPQDSGLHDTMTYDQETRVDVGLSSATNANLGASRLPFGSSGPIGCFICGAKDHRSAYCKNNAAMFD